MIYFCCEEVRRSLVRHHPSLNGIDHLEVVHIEEASLVEQQRKLRLYFVKNPSPALQDRFGADKFANAALVRVTGGQRTGRIAVDWAEWVDERLVVHVTPRGDYSRYTLSLVEPNSDVPLRELDPVLAVVDFSFKVECENEFDCRPDCACEPIETSAPDWDYLAKDYASFRQLMFDRLAVLAPQWRERNPADLGVGLVELLAYVGDYLSYRQDAIATEAYLGMARRRVSVRRHSRLLDYALHDGCNARVWVHVRVKPDARDGVVLPRIAVINERGGFQREEWAAPVFRSGDDEFPLHTRFATRLDSVPLLTENAFLRLAQTGRAEVFEPLERAHFFPEHNRMLFYTWGNSECCLPKGATKASLKDDASARLRLRPGDVLVFAENIGPRTGDPADADPARRHAVRLTRVQPESVLVEKDEHVVGRSPGPPVIDPVTGQPYVDIQWAEADALPFPFCLSSRDESDGHLLGDVSVALGNIVLADHGRTLPLEDLGTVPSPKPVLAPVSASACCHCDPSPRRIPGPRFLPPLKQRPLTQAAGYDSSRPALEAFSWTMKDVLPAIHLKDKQGRVWRPNHDLLSSGPFAQEFVAEAESDGRVVVRFGDDENGLAPGEGTRLDALYRIGNGTGGNIGTEALVHLVANFVLVPDGAGNLMPQSPADFIESVGNPLPGQRGIDPEPLEEVRQNAPAAFRVQQRAVTPDDYAKKAGEHPDVQRAAATLRWTGSWHTIFLTVDRRGGRAVDAAFEADLRRHLERYRLAGHDLEIAGPRYVPLELELRVCVSENFYRSAVVAALRVALDNRLHADSSRGFFHPDNFTFGQPVLLSRIYAAAQRVAGVRHAVVTILRRQGETAGELVPTNDVLTIGRLEIARLDHDSNFPDRGVLRFNPVGGR